MARDDRTAIVMIIVFLASVVATLGGLAGIVLLLLAPVVAPLFRRKDTPPSRWASDLGTAASRLLLWPLGVAIAYVAGADPSAGPLETAFLLAMAAACVLIGADPRPRNGWMPWYLLGTTAVAAVSRGEWGDPAVLAVTAVAVLSSSVLAVRAVRFRMTHPEPLPVPEPAPAG